MKNLEIVAINIEKLDIAVAGLRPSLKKYISKGIVIVPPPIPATTLKPLNMMNTTTPTHSMGN